MGTRSTIAIMQKDGSIQSIYAHWDGYLSGNGLTLFEHYQDIKKVKKLISLGSLSSLYEEVSPPKGVKHTFDTPIKGVTVFYGRDRGEDGVEPSSFTDLADYLSNGDFQGYDYIYKVGDKAWFFIDCDSQKIQRLDQMLLKDEQVPEESKQAIHQKIMLDAATKEKNTLEKVVKKTKKTSSQDIKL